jgi:hypothetical protein
MRPTTTPSVRKPDGGFCFIPAMAILRAWWAYKAGIIRLVDLRVWLACSEALARRCGLQKGRVPRYTLDELHALVGGVGGEHTRHSLSRLDKAGLVCWSETALQIGDGEAIEHLDDTGGLCRMAELTVNVRRKVPVPRRVVRFLAGGQRPVVIATVLGHLLRCVFYRKLGVRCDGLVKASWVADVFNVHERNVKAARSQLAHCGLLQLGTANQFVLNRYGLPTTLNLAWNDPERALVKREKAANKPPPRTPQSTTESPPPRKTGNSLTRVEHQKPGVPSPHGVRKRTGSGPRFPTLTTADLRNPVALVAFHEFAVSRGWCRSSEADRLFVCTAASHALRVGSRNPSGLLVWIVSGRRTSFVTQTDEDHGRALLGSCLENASMSARHFALVTTAPRCRTAPRRAAAPYQCPVDRGARLDPLSDLAGNELHHFVT